ncbi:MAG: FAD-dependent oxidoreductase [Methanomassiliicoccales archaeon]
MTDSDEIGAVMVVGGGIGGIQSALDLADAGFKVYMLERSPSIGGKMAKLDKTFPTNDCSICILAPKMYDCYSHPNIEVLTCSELTGLEGEPGHFKARVFKRARYVDVDKCTGCGICIEKCPSKGIRDEWELGVVERKAIYMPFAQAVPRAAVIDPDNCRYLTEGKCGVCAKVCERDAIDYEMQDEELEIEVGSVVLAPGYDIFDAERKREYGYGEYDNVMLTLEFERMLSASGPYAGEVRRPSDGKEPTRIAFLQCIGSRDEKVGNNYCSSVCCMYALKATIVAKEHNEELEPHIFFMDIRAVGKEFEDYRIRAQDEYGVKLHRGTRVASVEEDPETKNLIVKYSEGSESFEEEFDMVVLSVGLCPSDSAGHLSQVLNIDLNKYGFADTQVWTPLNSSREGVFVSGAFTSPKDIPTSVAEASGVAAKAASVIWDQRNTLAKPKEYPEEREVAGEEPRIGVFVCHCGINIGGVVNVPAVVEYAAKLPNVVHAEDNLYTCSQDTQENIKEMIEEHDLNRVIVASCTPRTHEPLFQSTIRETGLNPFLFQMANIRDQCSWVHMKDPERATEKAKDLVRMAISKVRLAAPLYRPTFPVGNSAAVIGGGLSGMTAALEIADQGFDVDLVEREDSLGGNLASVYSTQAGRTGPEVVEELAGRIRDNDRITVHLGAQLEAVEGYVGNFVLHTGQADIETGAIVVATGAEEYRPTEYSYGQDDRVLTQRELGKRLAEEPLNADTVAMIQCVGSRTKENPMCSRICCTSAMRNAIDIKESSPDTQVYVFFKDMRTYGFKEDLYREAAERGVKFIRMNDDEMPEMAEEDGKLVLTANDIILGEQVSVTADLVALSTGIRPHEDNENLAQMLKIPISKDGFFMEAHQKLRPVDFAADGIYLAGLAHWPKFAEESIAQSEGAAARAITVISRDEWEGTAAVPVVDQTICRGCGTCEEVCAFSAANLEEVEGVFKATINAALCKGCGSCGAACPSGAISMTHYTDDQLLREAKAALEEVLE